MSTATATRATIGQPATPKDQDHVVLPGQDPAGRHILALLVKRSYSIAPSQQCRRCEAARALVPGDMSTGDPMRSPILHESDFVPFKLATDVVVHATVRAPGSAPVHALDALVRVGEYIKCLRVTGDRTAHHVHGREPRFSDPVPFESMPITYDRAYGGVDVRSDPKLPFMYGRNHLGKGFVIADRADTVEGLDLPNIEAPDDLLTPARLCCGDSQRWQSQPMPDGLGWVMKSWLPRAGFAGVMPADEDLERSLRERYAAVLPRAQRRVYLANPLPRMDFRFFNGASPGLVRPYLAGDELLAFRNLHAAGDLGFWLPADSPKLGLDIGQGQAEAPAFLQTVAIRLDDGEVDLVWRAAFPYSGPSQLPGLRRLQPLIE